jgi:hypothetical protein
MIILGLDPGKTTGWALIDVTDRRITPINLGETQDMTCLVLRPQMQEADLIVIENFLVRPDKAKKGSFDYDPMWAPQVIGSLKTMAAVLEKKVVLQPSSIKPVGYGWANQRYVAGKQKQHKWDAVAHAVYYAVKHLNALPVGK